MPEIKIKHVVTFSSEDKGYPAENLVKSAGYKKWKNAKTGEKQASVTLQFEKASTIHQIDIGNESSAFVEVLVGKTNTADEEFQVILVASSFMNPMESRGNQNGTRVRIFNKDALSQAARDQKWDRVKVVCTQPFNKGIQYGLSFIKFYSKPEDGGETSGTSPKKQVKLGAFAMKADDSEDDISAGSLFAQKKEKKEPVPLTGAAAVRAASKLAEESRPSTSSTGTPSRKQPSPGPSKTPTTKRKLSTDGDKEDNDRTRHQPKESTTPKPSLQKQSTSLSSIASTTSSKGREGVPPLKKTRTEPPKQSKEKQFSRLMEKVTFVLSGFQHPHRGNLRDKAMEMGGKYKPDWGKGCTHLVCAFENTPKYNQVKGKGKIVKKEWVIDCYKSKKLLPWRNYRLGRAKSPPESSDESSGEEYSPVKKKTTPSKKESPKDKQSTQKAAKEEDYGSSTDDLSGMDTDDEIERLKAKQAKESTTAKGKSPAKSPAKASDESKGKSPGKAADQSKAKSPGKANGKSAADNIYDVSTDEEMDGIAPTDGAGNNGAGDFLDDLQDFFTDKVFFLYGKFSAADRRTLLRYIAAYDGEVEEYMTDKVHYVISDSAWDKNFDDALADNPNLAFVKSAWIHACHEKQKLLPHQKYVVVPK